MADVSRGRDQLARAKSLTDSEEAEISRLYDQAAQSLREEIRWRAQQVGHARAKSVLAVELAAAHNAAVLPQPALYPPPPSETTQQVEDELARALNDRVSRLKRRGELTKVQVSLTARADQIAARQSEIRESLQSLDDEISVMPLASASEHWEQARRMAHQARRQSLQQEIQALAAEHDALDLRRHLVPLQREAYLLKLEADERLLDDLRVRKGRARTLDAKKSMDSALNQAAALAEGFPQLSQVSAFVTSHAAELWGADGIAAKSDGAAVQTEQMRASLARFKVITADTIRRFQNSGTFAPASDWWPPRVDKFGKPAEVGVLVISYSAAEAVARRQLFKLEEELDRSPAFETELQQILASSGKQPNAPDFAEFKSRARSLLQLKRTVMDEYLNDSRVYVTRLGDASRVSKDLLLSIGELESFVLQRVLWARSIGESVSGRNFVDALLWFFSYRSWSQIVAGFGSSNSRLVLWIAGLMVILTLLRVRPRLKEKLCESRSITWQPGRFKPIFYTLILALLTALPLPLAIAYVGWVIGQAGEGVDLGRAMWAGAEAASHFLYLALLLRSMLADGGSSDRLMRWRANVRERLDRGLGRLIVVFTPLWFASTALASEGMVFSADPLLQSYNNSLGRLSFMAAVLSLLYIGRRILKPAGAVANALGSGYDAYGFARGPVFRVGLILVCSLVLLLAFAGFYITAYLTLKNLLTTAGWTVALMLASAVIRQWRLGQEERLTASRSPEDELVARQADVQVRRLSRFGLTLVWIVGLLFIWSVMLPTLSLLKHVELLPEFKVTLDKAPTANKLLVTGESPKSELQELPSSATAVMPIPGPAPVTPAAPVEPRHALYLSDVLLAIFVGVMTAMLVSNIPGVLQFTVLRRFALDVGGQYAVNTISRYVVIMVGLATVSGILSVNWSKVQWLAAALTFGIGFGLQEIFANFVSGLILLFDRSIRVGDVVTVGTLSGVVARIEMRATTVTLWDRSDMLVPNKEFVTTKLVNWSLSNPETRVDLKVGVGYGSDVEQVRDVLMRLAREHPAVQRQPEPQVLLTEFAASAILFELRVFCLFSYGRPVLLDELHRAVVSEFRKLGIEIAFPRLDVHIKAAPLIDQEPPPGLEAGV